MKKAIIFLALLIPLHLLSQEHIGSVSKTLSGASENQVTGSITDISYPTGQYYFSETDSTATDSLKIITFSEKSLNEEYYKEVKALTTPEKWLKVNKVSIYGGGGILGLVTGEKESEEVTSPTGSLGLNIATQKLAMSLYFSYNSKQTIKMDSLNNFGNALINPNLGGHSLNVSVLGQVFDNFGVSTNLQIADNVWELEGNNKVDASPLIYRLGLYTNPFDINLSDNEIQFTISAHYTHRSILGDFSNEDQIIEGKKISARGYNGWDFSINTYLNKVKFYVQLSSNSTGEFNIPGFSGTQVLFGLAVTGDVIKLK